MGYVQWRPFHGGNAGSNPAGDAKKTGVRPGDMGNGMYRLHG